MDPQTIINTVASFALAGVSWFARVLWEANKDLRKDLALLREEIPKTYVSKIDFRDFAREIKDLLIGIDSKLDRKADK